MLVVLGLTPNLIGCGEGDPRSVVTGTVTLDGEYLPGGEILLVPTEPNQPTERGAIQHGAYTLRAAPGPKKVMIRWERNHPTKKVPGADPGTMIPLREQMIPSRYNDQTELTAEVVAGDNEFNFDLKSK